MSELKATPGPWERRTNEDGSVIRIEPAAERGKALVAYVTPHTLKNIVGGVMGRDDGTNYANAALIAASPRMFQAINDFLYALDRGFLDCKDDSAFIDDLRVVRALARGEQP